MSEVKHTPGPWKYQHSQSKDAYNVIGTIPGCLYKIARCPYYTLPESDISSSTITERNKVESEANAKLIAAAPQLLDALQQVEKRLTEMMYRFCDSPSDVDNDFTIVAIRKAIKSAL